ncbi:conserved hypothetical protein [Planktothrix tepida PCC 9214]|uniref:Uncharacterized protein n=1 Tax=Planktothrix tepida PCC 9214 TaxID=671072 RepID=A0A1J1LQT8_9CYAN|nr:conserved hypothetical protein [Planktothrix tepida PCC 9214]
MFQVLTISNLVAIGKLDLLQKIYGKMIIRKAVYKEIINGGYFVRGSTEIKNLLTSNVSSLVNNHLQ